jgi:alkanesulfonate monooxygenase SsuD/methylene tetrahydromethanopterin reductase-like flavin-dependent oxidoreductase (luciferase family)
MPDYGHDLLFGSFITPRADRPEVTVGLARLSEEVGLDLVTFQDHPYQPAFLDTWTLLSHVSAVTSRVQLAPDVANLPLRMPAVLARSAASLDRLSGGRMSLGLGAGAFWDAIEAMGGRRLTGGQAVQSLEEAIAIIRGVWDVADRQPLRVAGEFHHVAGAKRGPAPAHDIPIWLGVYRPRMLGLVGRLADGWLPSLGRVELDALVEANTVIDDAAAEAGRPPAAVRRLLNINGQLTSTSGGFLVGPPRQWAEELTTLVLEHGFSAFILGGDDPDVQRAFAQDVAPAVREAVAAERGRAPGATGPVSEPAPAGTAAPASGTAPAAQGATPAPSSSDLGVTLTPPPPPIREHSLLDEPSRPSRPEPPVGTVYTDQGRAAGRHLVEVHDMLRAELTQVRDLVEQVSSGALAAAEARSTVNAMALRQNDWTMGAYCASYCTVVDHHHRLEDDGIFPHLRAVEPGLDPVILRLTAEHRVIHEVLGAVDRALVDLIRAGDVPADHAALRVAVDGLTDTLNSHFAYEEEQIVEPLARFGLYPGQL